MTKDRGEIGASWSNDKEIPISFPLDSSIIELGTYPRCVEENLWHITMKAVDLSGLSQFPNLESLIILDNTMSKIDLTPLPSCPLLKKFVLNDNEVEELDISPLGKCNSLQYLTIAGSRIKEIDLKPISYCTALEELAIVVTEIQIMDLDFLTNCTALRELNLSDNLFRNIDLTPLSSCTQIEKIEIRTPLSDGLESITLVPLPALRELDLEDHNLQQIDLTPLGLCPGLEIVNLSSNRFGMIELDLTPLHSCKSLQQVILGCETHNEIDYTPLVYCPNIWKVRGLGNDALTLLDKRTVKLAQPRFAEEPSLDSICFSMPHRMMTLDKIEFLRDTLDKYEPEFHWKYLHLLHNALDIRGLQWLGLLDVNPQDLLDFVLNREQNSQSVMNHIVTILCEQIDRGGTTIGLDINKAAQIADLVIRIEDINHLRLDELKHIIIPKHKHYLNLQPLWCTHYGQLILHSYDAGLSCSFDMFKVIKKAVVEIGGKIKTKRGGKISTPNNISSDLHQYYLALVKYRTNQKSIRTVA